MVYIYGKLQGDICESFYVVSWQGCFFLFIYCSLIKTYVTFSILQDLHTIYCHLYHMDVLSHLREHQLR